MAIKLAPNAFDFSEGAAPATPDAGYVRLYAKADNFLYQKDDAGVETRLSGGTGDVVGPGSSTDNAVARFDGTTGKLLQNSGVTINDSGRVFINPSADSDALWIKQHAAQTLDPLLITDSDENDQIRFLANGGAVFNEEGNDVDFRVETDTNANALFVDGGSNNVGIGTGTPDASALLDIVSTTKGLGLPSMTTTQRDAIGTPRDGLTVYDSDLDLVYVRANGTWSPVGTTLPVVDTTAIVKGSADATKLLRLEVDGFTTATTRVLTPPNYDGTIATLAGVETLTNKTIDADGTGNVITNIGSSEVKAELITGLTADGTPDVTADYVMTYDASATALKKVLVQNLVKVTSANYIFDDSPNWTTTSTSFVDIDATDLSLTITTNGKPVRISFHGIFSVSTTLHLYLNFTIDGTVHAADDGILRNTMAINATYALSFTRWITGLSAAAHTFNMRWKVSTGTATLYAGAGTAGIDTHGQFWVEEIS